MTNLTKNTNSLYDLFLNNLFDSSYAFDSSMMRTNIKETETTYEMEIEIPYAKKENISLSLEEGYLTVKASENDAEETSTNEKENKDKFLLQERSNRTYERAYNIGENVTEENIKAKYENGILFVTITKPTKEQLAMKTIQID